MISHTLPYAHREGPPRRRSLLWSVLWVVWQFVRLPVLAVLLVLEPLVSLILTAFGFLGIVVTLTLKLSGDLPRFPFWLMLAFSISAILVLMAVHALIGIFSR